MTTCYIGIDLGTSGVKVIAVDAAGSVVGSASESFDFDRPRADWAETPPSRWWEATAKATRTLMSALGRAEHCRTSLTMLTHKRKSLSESKPDAAVAQYDATLFTQALATFSLAFLWFALAAPAASSLLFGAKESSSYSSVWVSSHFRRSSTISSSGSTSGDQSLPTPPVSQSPTRGSVLSRAITR